MISHNNSDPTVLPTLQEVRRKAALTSRHLAEAAGVSLRIEYVMEIGGRVSQHDASHILAALSRLTGQQYGFDNVQVHLIHEVSASLPRHQPGRGTTPPDVSSRRKG